jgi:hypothetical protein
MVDGLRKQKGITDEHGWGGNPKPEIRSPKEARNPNPESATEPGKRSNDGHGFFTEGNKGHDVRKRRKSHGRMIYVVAEEFRDPITRAYERERRARVRFLEEDCGGEHLFKCVCCGRRRTNGKRREPDSEVCIHCVREAGFWN